MPDDGYSRSTSSLTNKIIDIKHVSEISFIWYVQNRKIGKPNNLKIWEQ
jgi:hypothetical protein